jgi:hypothetical protein
MATDPVVDEEYVSSQDSDFAPEDGPEHDSAGESDEEADSVGPGATAKRKQRDGDHGDAGYENSGDEAVIEKGKKRRKRAKEKDRDDEDHDDEGEGSGGFVKTRRQRAQEYEDPASAHRTAC